MKLKIVNELNKNPISHLLHPYELHIFCGPMKSGKSRELQILIEQLSYTDIKALIIKPQIDTRTSFSRAFSDGGVLCNTIINTDPQLILNFFDDDWYDVVIIDEAQFFNDDLVLVVDELVKSGVYVVVAGLDLDFRGEIFGPMGKLLSKADKVVKLSGICDYEGCNFRATRTQREIDGIPASYNSPIILVGDSVEGYSCRCIKHHFVTKE